MSVPEASRDFRQWLRYAEEDLTFAASAIHNPDAAPRHACFLAQQGAEKAIKAIFVFLNIGFPYRHDLEFLVALLPDGWDLDHHIPHLARLTGWVVEGRYPYELPEPTRDDADQSLRHANAIVDDIRTMLIRHGAKID